MFTLRSTSLSRQPNHNIAASNPLHFQPSIRKTPPMPRLTLFALLFLFTSCATIINKRSYKASFTTNAENATLKVYDSTYTLPAKVTLQRSRKDLTVTLLADTVSKDYILHAIDDRLTFAGNIITQGALCPIGIMIDRKNEKGYYYRRHVFLDINHKDSVVVPKDKSWRNLPIGKGRVNLSISMPWVNQFYLDPVGVSPKNTVGFLGLAVGLEYYYRDDTFVKINGTGIMDFMVPMPASIFGEYEIMTALGVSVTNNHRLGRFAVGYGPNWMRSSWRHIGAEDPVPGEPDHLTDHSLGLFTSGHYQLGRSFHVGLLYQPSLYSFAPGAGFRYQHTISLDLLWKINL